MAVCDSSVTKPGATGAGISRLQNASIREMRKIASFIFKDRICVLDIIPSMSGNEQQSR